jgi:hypothetical protein
MTVDTYKLPREPLAGEPPLELSRADHIETITQEHPFDCDQAHRCADYESKSFLYTFLQRTEKGDQNLAPDMVLGDVAENVILLVTDLQPDVDKKPGDTKERMDFVQEEFADLVGRRHMSIGVLPVPARFYGWVWDTGATDARGAPMPIDLNKLDVKQPLFLITIGREEQVRWVLQQLKTITQRAISARTLPEEVVFTGRRPQIDQDPYHPDVSAPGKDEEDPLLVSLASLPPSELSEATAGRAFGVKRSALQHGETVIKFAAKGISLPSTLDSYSLVIEGQPKTSIWEYLSGWFANPECKKRWSDVTKALPFLGATFGPDGTNLVITLTASDIAGMNPDATYYIEEKFDVHLQRDNKPLPGWVEGWDFDWTNEKDRRDSRSAKGPFDIALGVNKLSHLFQSTRESVIDEPHPVTLRYAIRLEE